MKELPPDPPVYSPPPQRWFERYEHPEGEEPSPLNMSKDMAAMWLIFLDCCGLPLPEKASPAQLRPSLDEAVFGAAAAKRRGYGPIESWRRCCIRSDRSVTQTEAKEVFAKRLLLWVEFERKGKGF